MQQKKLSEFEAIIFDMDGVLIDSERIWQQKEPDFIAELMPNFPAERCHEFAGRSANGIYEILKEYNPSFSLEEWLEKFRVFGRTEIYTKTPLFPGVKNLLRSLSMTHKVGLASSSLREWIEKVVTKQKIEPFFAAICSAEDIGGISKPAPDIFLHTAKQLWVKPENCLVIEDANSGVRAGKAAGMTVYGFRNGVNDQQDFSEADFIFSDFTSLEL